MTSQEKRDTSDASEKRAQITKRGGIVFIARAIFHLLMVSAVAALLAIATMDIPTIQLYFASVGEHFQPDWSRVGIHIALSATIWAMFALFYAAFKKKKRANRVVRAPKSALMRGAVMLETLIAIFPFLLLTSGLAQFGLNNSAFLLADLAAYQGARTAWLWKPEAELGRLGATDDDVTFRARTAAALVLAPSAPSSYWVGRNFPGGSGPPFRRVRTAITASFRTGPGLTGQQEWSASGSNWSYFMLDTNMATARNTNYQTAFDDVSMHLRAGRKCTQAWMALEDDFEVIEVNGEVGVKFGYKHNQVFPWFAYITGGLDNVAQRIGNYQVIKRQMTIPAQPSMR